MDYVKMTAPCGLACFDCVAYRANESEELRARVTEHFGIPREQAACPGCREVKGRCPMSPGFCTIFPCAEERGVTFCYECADFPCDALHPHADQADRTSVNTQMFNLCLIKKLGLERWAKEKAAAVKAEYFSGKVRLKRAGE